MKAEKLALLYFYLGLGFKRTVKCHEFYLPTSGKSQELDKKTPGKSQELDKKNVMNFTQ